jgi:CRP/FNR family transcriptional regulator, dissimilatory nitrate respiration regulator
MPLLKKPDEGRSGDRVPAALAALGRRREVGAGELLFRQGEPSERCFLLEKGEVALRRLSRRGDEVEIARIGEGEWFGEAVLFAGRPFPAQAVAVKKSLVLEFRRALLLSSTEPETKSFFLSLLAGKCLALSGRIEQLIALDARERLAGFVLGLCPGGPAGCEGAREACSFFLPKKKREIAIELGMTPETLSRALRRMEEGGYLRISGSRVEIPSCALLRSLLEEG